MIDLWEQAQLKWSLYSAMCETMDNLAREQEWALWEQMRERKTVVGEEYERLIEQWHAAIQTPVVTEPKTKIGKLQTAYDDAKKHCNHFPDNGHIEYRRGSGYTVWYRDNRAVLRVYCWLGTFERAMRFIQQAKTDGIPCFSNLRVGVK